MKKFLGLLFCRRLMEWSLFFCVFSAVGAGIAYEIIGNPESLAQLRAFGQSSPVLAKTITVILILMPICAPAVIIYLFMAPLFTLVPKLYDKEAAYCEKIQLLLYSTLASAVATVLSVFQYALFLTVKDELTGLWNAFFVITAPTITIFVRMLPLVTTLGSLFCVFQRQRYLQEIKSFYFMPYMYLLAATVNIALSALWISDVDVGGAFSGYLLISLLIILGILGFYSIRAAHMDFKFLLKKIIPFCVCIVVLFCIFYFSAKAVGEKFYFTPAELKTSAQADMESALDLLILRPDIHLGRKMADLIAGGMISNTTVMSLVLSFTVLLWFYFVAITSKHKKKRCS